MVHPTDRSRSKLRRVILVSQLWCTQKKPQDLWIGRRCPSGDEVEQGENKKSAQQAAEQVERCRAKTQRKEKQFSLCAENRERAGERTVNDIDASCIRHRSPEKGPTC